MAQNKITVDTVLERYRQQAIEAGYNMERIKGTAFERLAIAFIAHDPLMQQTYYDPVPYEEWAREHEMYKQDCGIDLVASLRNETNPDGTPAYCAIQCKFYREGTSVTKKDIDSFLAESGTGLFARRLIIDTTGKEFNRNVVRTLSSQRTCPVSRITLDVLRGSPIDWETLVTNTNDTDMGQRQTNILRPHQQEAFQSATEGLREAGQRGKMIMACGTGKTLTSLRVAEHLAGVGGKVLYLVPSLALMSQTVREWVDNANQPMRAFAVCSDSQVGRRRVNQNDLIDMDIMDLVLPATTNAERLAETVTRGGEDTMTVIFATYHSLPTIREAQQVHGVADFDIAICDEAHRTAGARGIPDSEDSHFVMIHDQDQIRADRRLYMTATPKVYAQQARTRAGALEGNLCSMEDAEIYGDVLYEIGFGEAVNRNLLSDYKVIVLSVPAEIAARAANAAPNVTIQMDDAGKLVGCWRALAKMDHDQFPENDRAPMHRAIAYCRDINSSKLVSDMICTITDGISLEDMVESDTLPDINIAAEHVDGTFSAFRRTERLDWLSTANPDECRILTNARCLAEGVDVPSLDAILFMHPRKSQIEVVQAVGRVMRKAHGKEMGYVILPVVIPNGSNPEDALNDNSTFRVVWQVLNAIRSHDERFEAMINLIEAGGNPGDRIGIISLADWVPPAEPGNILDPEVIPPVVDPDINLQLEFDLPAAIQAKIVEKCGNRKYWEEWAGDVADIAQRQIERIRALVNDNEATRDVFTDFLKELRDDLNEGITENDAIEMLAQHMVTGPVFDALFGGLRFVERNPVSRGLETLLEVLRPDGADSEIEGLEEFYTSVQRRAEAATGAQEKQKLAVELYDKFFRKAFPKTAQQLGIVYTPVEAVDFIINSVNDALREEFGQTLGSEGVHILDPFTGTGTFLVRLIQSGLIGSAELTRKYHHELHANELVLLAYYIAAVNIEAAYREVTGLDEEEDSPFTGICLNDTFESTGEDLLSDVLKSNSDRRDKQRETEIRVIIGNPPYSAGQRSENDAAQNQEYSKLDERIADTYVFQSQAELKRYLYDSYVRAFRWSSDRIGQSGIIGFISNSAWLERSFADGMRKCLGEEFSTIHVFHLRGDIRKDMLSDGEAGEGENVFGQGSMTGIAITILIKNPDAAEKGQILFHDIGKNKTREQKLAKITEFSSIQGISRDCGWQKITPDAHNDWLEQRNTNFARFTMLGNKDKAREHEPRLFKNYSLGVVTNRDAWCLNFSALALEGNIQRLIDNYNGELNRFKQEKIPSTKDSINNFVDPDPTRISWTSNLKIDLGKRKPLDFTEGSIVPAINRPFTRQHLYFSRRLNERVYQMPQIFPYLDADNMLICVSGIGSRSGFSVLMTNAIPDLQFVDNGQCFPFYLYEKVNSIELPLTQDKIDEHGYRRREALTDEALRDYQSAFGNSVTKDDIFHYIYGLLHLPVYREQFAANLKKELPRIPLPIKVAHFHSLVEAGRSLGILHLSFDSIDPWPVEFEKGGWKPTADYDYEDWFRVTKMKHPGRGSTTDPSRIIYNQHITVCGIPKGAWNYIVNGKPALKWVMLQQVVKPGGKSGIVKDPNHWAATSADGPSYPLKLLARVVRVAIETQNIIAELPDPEWRDD
ncbi:MAG: DEAD/DEAH box helicase family protein [Paracoccaceae bacterium]|nr:DEAD/DEAH box helicase family protein [Paracoccaceae bacterium]